MRKHVSTRAALLVCFSLPIAALGCVDAKQRLLDFDDRVGTRDATVISGDGCAECDITGRHYLAVDPSIDPDPTHLIHYIVNATMEGQGAGKTVTLEFLALDFTNRELVGTDDFGAERLPAAGGVFEMPLADAVIPAAANSVLAGSASVTITTGEILGTVLTDDSFCGIINGMTDLGSALDGSTFGAVRVGPNDIGATLPEPTVACPDEGGQDAGPDAPIADASTFAP